MSKRVIKVEIPFFGSPTPACLRATHRQEAEEEEFERAQKVAEEYGGKLLWLLQTVRLLDDDKLRIAFIRLIRQLESAYRRGQHAARQEQDRRHFARVLKMLTISPN